MMQMLRCVSVAVVLVAATSVPSRAQANEYPTISLSAAGANRPLPLGSGFYLEGPIGEHVEQVHAVFVRYQYSVWGGLQISHVPKSCSDVAGALTVVAGDGKQDKLQTASGVRKVSEIWVAPPASSGDAVAQARLKDFGALTDDEALFPPPWTKAPKDEKFRIFVGADTFFRPGAAYCLLSFERTKTTKREHEAVQAAVAKFGEASGKCAKDAACQQKHFDELLAEIRKQSPEAKPEDLDAIIKNVKGKLADAAAELATRPATAEAIARSWHVAVKSPDLAGPFDVTDGALGEWLANSLARNGALLKVGAAPFQYFSTDGKQQVRQLVLLEDLSGMVLIENASSPRNRPLMKVDLQKIYLPDSSISVREVLELSRGRILKDKQYVELGILGADFRQQLGLENGTVRPDKNDQLRQISDRLAALKAVVAVSLKESHADVGSTTLGRDVFRPLGVWWQRSVATDCGAVLSSWGSAYAAASCARGVAGTGWPGYPPNVDPLESLHTELAEYREAAETWSSARDGMSYSVTKALLDRPKLAPVQSRMTMNRDTWVFSYVTPITGHRWVMAGRGQDFQLQHAGVQVYLYPNSVDEPMWTNGFVEDLPRMLAFEVSAGLGNGPYGSEKRIQGVFPGLPPVFAAVSAQIIPYTSGSAGLAFLQVKRTSLPDEVSELRVMPTLSLSVQANIPDLIAALRGRTTSTTTEVK